LRVIFLSKADYRIKDSILISSLQERCKIGESGEYIPPVDFLFPLLAYLETTGAEIWAPAWLADHLKISRQAVNNMIKQGKLTIISSDCSRWSLKFIVITSSLRDSIERNTRSYGAYRLDKG
jgi:hypothetical protein